MLDRWKDATGANDIVDIDYVNNSVLRNGVLYTLNNVAGGAGDAFGYTYLLNLDDPTSGNRAEVWKLDAALGVISVFRVAAGTYITDSNHLACSYSAPRVLYLLVYAPEDGIYARLLTYRTTDGVQLLSANIPQPAGDPLSAPVHQVMTATVGHLFCNMTDSRVSGEALFDFDFEVLNRLFDAPTLDTLAHGATPRYPDVPQTGGVIDGIAWLGNDFLISGGGWNTMRVTPVGTLTWAVNPNGRSDMRVSGIVLGLTPDHAWLVGRTIEGLTKGDKVTTAGAVTGTVTFNGAGGAGQAWGPVGPLS